MSESSKLFEEFVIRRCEEITQKDKKHQELNSKLLQAESDFKKTLSQDQIKKYYEIEEVVIELAIHSGSCIYKQAVKDRS